MKYAISLNFTEFGECHLFLIWNEINTSNSKISGHFLLNKLFYDIS